MRLSSFFRRLVVCLSYSSSLHQGETVYQSIKERFLVENRSAQDKYDNGFDLSYKRAEKVSSIDCDSLFALDCHPFTLPKDQYRHFKRLNSEHVLNVVHLIHNEIKWMLLFEEAEGTWTSYVNYISKMTDAHLFYFFHPSGAVELNPELLKFMSDAAYGVCLLLCMGFGCNLEHKESFYIVKKYGKLVLKINPRMVQKNGSSGFQTLQQLHFGLIESQTLQSLGFSHLNLIRLIENITGIRLPKDHDVFAYINKLTRGPEAGGFENFDQLIAHHIFWDPAKKMRAFVEFHNMRDCHEFVAKRQDAFIKLTNYFQSLSGRAIWMHRDKKDKFNAMIRSYQLYKKGFKFSYFIKPSDYIHAYRNVWCHPEVLDQNFIKEKWASAPIYTCNFLTSLCPGALGYLRSYIDDMKICTEFNNKEKVAEMKRKQEEENEIAAGGEE